MSATRRAKRLSKLIKVRYDDDPGEGNRDVTIRQTPGGRVARTVSVGTPEAVTLDFTDPWTNGFFDKNSEAFVADSLPDDLLDSSLSDQYLDSSEETKDLPKVFTFVHCYCKFTDKRLPNEADSPIESWKVHDRSIYLDELLRHDGRAGESSCSFCSDKNGLFKCIDCFGGRLHCQACIVTRHSTHPLHQIEVGAYIHVGVLI